MVKYTIFIPSEGFFYRHLTWPFNSDVDENVRLLMFVKGTSGDKVGFRMQSGGLPVSSLLHTFDGGWQLIDLTHQIKVSLGGGIIGFEKREAILPGSSTTDITFLAWGLGWLMG